MMTSSNGNIFRVTGPLCGEFTGPGEFPAQSPVTGSFDVFFALRLNKRLSKHSRGWWFETAPWSLWRQCNATGKNCWPPLIFVCIYCGIIIKSEYDYACEIICRHLYVYMIFDVRKNITSLSKTSNKKIMVPSASSTMIKMNVAASFTDDD